jgi:bifunctional non-homologous end joining protein LigD
VKEIFDRFKLKTFAKTSGSKGLQLYVPLNTPVTYDDTKGFSHAIARLLEKEHPDLIVSEMKKTLRVGKVFVDWSQNDVHKTTVNVYSLRAKERPTVSTPVTWDEVELCLKKKDANLLVFDSDQALARVEKMGDIFAPVLTLKQRLPDVSELGTPPDKAARTRTSGTASSSKGKGAPRKKQTRTGAPSSTAEIPQAG